MAEIRPLWLRVPHRPSDEEIEQDAQVGRWHSEWVERHADETPFHPEGRPEGSDYPLHFLHLEASGEALDEYHAGVRRILGLPD